MQIKANIAYWCKTEELAREFLQECRKQKIRWNSGDDLHITNWEYYKEKTCYIYNAKFINSTFEGLLVSNCDYELGENIEIVEYKGANYDNSRKVRRTY